MSPGLHSGLCLREIKGYSKLDSVRLQEVLFLVAPTFALSGRLEVRFKELLHRVRVPFVDVQCLLEGTAVVIQFNSRIQAPHVLDLQVRELGRSVTLNERLNLRISSELAGAHFQNGPWVFAIYRAVRVPLAALLAMRPAKDLLIIQGVSGATYIP